ncbi:MAG: hypothetical protein PF440_04110 [Thiomicrorhabdus sp.]|jgi:hypothetical protein|nr:hypothetical protein [Thiomicrorhabdus sp.]
MTEETKNAETNDTDTPSELTLLKQRADTLGIQYHPNIGLATLKTKVTDKLKSPGPVEKEPVKEAPVAATPAVETSAMRNARIRKEATKLVRVRISCMNPLKSKWDGEYFEVSNKAIGTIKKYVPFNAGDEGWHVPHVIYKMLLAKKFQTFYEVKNGRNKTKRGKLVSEFNIQELKPLTPVQLKELATVQAASRNID